MSEKTSATARFLPPIGYLWIAIAAVTLIVTANLVVDLFGALMRGSGKTTDSAPVRVEVAGVPMSIPANMIRYAGERGGALEQIDLFFHWPSLSGFSEEHAQAFRRSDANAPVILMRVLGPDSRLPPSERLYRIYEELFQGAPVEGPGGLTGRRIAPGHGYDGDMIYYQADSDRPYVARCGQDEAAPVPSCLREVTVSPGLAVHYRFGKGLLGDWRQIDAAVVALVEAFVATAR